MGFLKVENEVRAWPTWQVVPPIDAKPAQEGSPALGFPITKPWSGLAVCAPCADSHPPSWPWLREGQPLLPA